MNSEVDQSFDFGSSAPAIAGGEPAFPGGFPEWPGVDPDVTASVDRALADGDWGRYSGKYHARLIEKISQQFEQEHVQLCSSGTIATEIALHALNIGPESEVILAGYDFSGNFRGVEAVGAFPVLADIQPENWCLDVNSVRECISDSTAAVIVSHLHGGLADLASLKELADTTGFKVIEDACQVPGAMNEGKKLGVYADVLTLSFGGSKLLTAGRGGAVLTNDVRTATRIRTYCERGNNAFALSELQSAALLPQLDKLEFRNKRRLESVKALGKYCGSIWPQIDVLTSDERSQPSFYKVPWLIPDELDRDRLIHALQAEGIAADAGFRGFLSRSQRRCRKATVVEHCQDAVDNTIVLHHPILLESEDSIKRLADTILRNYAYLLKK